MKKKKRFAVRVTATISLSASSPFLGTLLILVPSPSTAYHEPHIQGMISRDRCDYTHHMYMSDNGSASHPLPPPQHNKQNHCNRASICLSVPRREAEHLLASPPSSLPPANIEDGWWFPILLNIINFVITPPLTYEERLNYDTTDPNARHIRPETHHVELKASIKRRPEGWEISSPKVEYPHALVENEN